MPPKLVPTKTAAPAAAATAAAAAAPVRQPVPQLPRATAISTPPSTTTNSTPPAKPLPISAPSPTPMSTPPAPSPSRPPPQANPAPRSQPSTASPPPPPPPTTSTPPLSSSQPTPESPHSPLETEMHTLYTSLDMPALMAYVDEEVDAAAPDPFPIGGAGAVTGAGGQAAAPAEGPVGGKAAPLAAAAGVGSVPASVAKPSPSTETGGKVPVQAPRKPPPVGLGATIPGAGRPGKFFPTTPPQPQKMEYFCTRIELTEVLGVAADHAWQLASGFGKPLLGTLLGGGPKR
ncbi:MAG: hypothetical protein Q9227_009294 [Pyrenula ochraceoflavens]